MLEGDRIPTTSELDLQSQKNQIHFDALTTVGDKMR